MLRKIQNLTFSELYEKRVLLRVDFNVPIKDKIMSDDTRISAALPTINFLTKNGAKVILISHLGRPCGTIDKKLSLAPIRDKLCELTGKNIIMASDCIGSKVEHTIASMTAGNIVLLENVRFYAEESKNDETFSKQLASLADIFVNDAFGLVHRAHASNTGVTKHLPSYAGYLIQKEVDFLSHAIESPKRPLIAIIGGAKISTKTKVLKNLLDKVDKLIIGGGMAFTILKAKGYEIGKSLFEEDQLQEAKSFLEKAKTSKAELFLPLDQIVTENIKDSQNVQTVDIKSIPSDMLGVDIGPKTIDSIKKSIKDAGTIIWNGPLGVFEVTKFSTGTCAVAEIMADSNAITIIGGGDSASAISQAGLSDKMTHVSTGGGASLEFLEGSILPGLQVLLQEEVV
ncbi:MAG: phosphoglycerate kinase [bacterium]|nr:phosphoglycerate kinase [bacterium]